MFIIKIKCILCRDPLMKTSVHTLRPYIVIRREWDWLHCPVHHSSECPSH